jgi:GT2 family glycosyltransferase
MPQISVLIVTWNRREALHRALESVLKQTHKNIEIVVVDNASTDDTRALLRDKYRDVIYIGSHKNLGCPSGRNLGFTHCRGKYVYCLDDDGWLKEDALEYSVQRAESEPRIAVVQSQINEVRDERVVLQRPSGAQGVYINSFSGGCSLFRREAIQKVGYYPDDFLRQAEEEDLALRLLDAEYLCFFEPKSVMFHAASPIARSGKEIYYYTLRNTMIIGLKRWPAPWNILRVLVVVCYACKAMLARRWILLPYDIFSFFFKNIARLARERTPIKRSTFRLYRALKKQPSVDIPIK